MKYSFLWTTVGGLLVAGSQLAACSDDKEPVRTRIDFCADWAEAACSSATVTACQAATAETCRSAQQTYCQGLVPASFSDDRGDDCINAVGDAYDDADLTGTEIDTVRRLGGACSGIVTGTQALGQACDADSDCDRSQGVECIQRGGVSGGTCMVPIVVGAGQACSQPAQSCTPGFYCDGNNCIAAKSAGAACQNDVECAPSGYCAAETDRCVARLPVGGVCTVDNECQSLFCYEVDGDDTCADLIRLSPAEDICDDLR